MSRREPRGGSPSKREAYDRTVRGKVDRLVEKHRHTGTGAPADIVRRVLRDPEFPNSPDAIRQLEDVFGAFRRKGQEEDVRFDYDDIVQQSFPSSDPPPPLSRG